MYFHNLKEIREQRFNKSEMYVTRESKETKRLKNRTLSNSQKNKNQLTALCNQFITRVSAHDSRMILFHDLNIVLLYAVSIVTVVCFSYHIKLLT